MLYIVQTSAFEQSVDSVGARRIGKSIAASLVKAPRASVGSTVVRDDFIHPSKMIDTTVLPGDSARIMSAAVSPAFDTEGEK